MNNFYGFENLELAYIVSDIEIANLLQKSQLMDMPLNKLNEEIARKAFMDVKYNKFIRKSINKEKKRLYKIFDENDIKYFLSETNYIFINPNKSREVFANELEKHKMILYASDDKYNSYWTFPIMDKATNDKTVKILLDKM
jgi:histidinol-phosphate/aromatic aminotransferase/cobyric acid decarboxylase-like protein